MELICQILNLSKHPIIDLQELLVGDAVVGGAGVRLWHVVLNVDTDDKLHGLPINNMATLVVASLCHISCVVLELITL